MKKLLLISGAFPPMKSPEADHAFHLCRHLADCGLDLQVLTTMGSITAADPRVQVHAIMRDWSWWDLPRLVRFIRLSRPDAVALMYIGWIYNEHPMMTFAATLAKALQPQAPFVTQFENAEGASPHRTSLLSRAIRKAVSYWVGRQHLDYSFGTLLRDSDRLIVLSEHHKEKLAGLLPDMEKKCVVVPPPPMIRMVAENGGAVRTQGRHALGVKSDECLLVFFGRVYPGKGIETLFKAVQLVVSRGRPVRLVLVGGLIDKIFPHRPSYAREISELPRAFGIADRVKWTGEYECDSERPSVYLRAADLCVLPFDCGVQLNNSSFATAAAHGLPIITTQGKLLEQPFIHEENLFLCPPKSPEAMAAAIERLMDAPALRQRLRTGALTLAGEWFSWERALDRTIETLSPT